QEAKRDIGKPLLQPTTPAPAPLGELPEAAGSLGGIALMNWYDELLNQIPMTREGSNLVVRAKLPAHAAPTLPLVALGAAAFWTMERRAMVAPAQRLVPATVAPPRR